MRGRPGDTSLAALATLVVSWPLSTLMVSANWVRPAVLLVLVVAGLGMAIRVLAVRGWQVLLGQLVGVMLALSWMFGEGTRWYGLPTWRTAQLGAGLVAQAVRTIQSFSAPAPTTPGLILLVGATMALVALAVDYLAVTRRSPAAAGLPLLAAFLASAANSGSSLHPVFFAAAALVWLVMVGRQGITLLRRWSTTSAAPLSPLRDLGTEVGLPAYTSAARTMGVGALALALLLPVVLPHLPTRYLLAGLGRSDATSTDTGAVGFSPSADLAQDLADRSSDPVLVYRTSAPSPGPLRVAVTSTYYNGRWTSDGFIQREPSLVFTPNVPAPAGLSPDVQRDTYELSVLSNRLRAPELAVPYPMVSGDLHGIRWRVDTNIGSVSVRAQPPAYSIRFADLHPTRAQLLAATVPTFPITAQVGELDTMSDPASLPVVSPLTRKVTADARTPYEKASAIQAYLRGSDFTYSLKLAGPARDAGGHVRVLDPLSNFLLTKKGYCVQFATAMIMMARAAGIPARLVTGFLPGTSGNDGWTVRVSDAHAWPELFFNGLGWLRFEPTPPSRSGVAPSYTSLPAVGGDSNGSSTAGATPTTAGPGISDKRVDIARAGATGLGASAAGASASLLHRLPAGWPLVLLCLVLGLCGVLVVPGASWWQRRRRYRRARDDAGRVEAQWRSLTERLGDLGVPAPPARTPRQLGDYYDREAYLEGEHAEALSRLVQTLERSRYAPPGRGDEDVAAVDTDTRTVLQAAGQSRLRRHRLLAALWPASGRAELQRGWHQLGRAVTRPWRKAVALVAKRGRWSRQ